jgi:trk system potassium uptake protein TrkH
VANRQLLYQTKVFWIEVAVVLLIMTLYLYNTSDKGLEESLRLSAFNIVSVATTTGYATTDYSLWGGFAIIVFYFLTVTGGCTGSTSGGIKTFRLVVMAKTIVYQTKKLIMPNGVFSARMGGTVVKEDIMTSVGIFFLLYVFVFIVLSLCLAATGLDMLTSFSGVAQAMSGVGPGLGDIIGPAGNFIPLSDFAKWSLVVAMIVGRLEIMTVLVLLSKNFWID